jgi:hypothetical protein
VDRRRIACVGGDGGLAGGRAPVFGRILYGVDGTPASLVALQQGCAAQAGLTAVHAAELLKNETAALGEAAIAP